MDCWFFCPVVSGNRLLAFEVMEKERDYGVWKNRDRL